LKSIPDYLNGNHAREAAYLYSYVDCILHQI
jgi:hypothetical protein